MAVRFTLFLSILFLSHSFVHSQSATPTPATIQTYIDSASEKERRGDWKGAVADYEMALKLALAGSNGERVLVDRKLIAVNKMYAAMAASSDPVDRLIGGTKTKFSSQDYYDVIADMTQAIGLAPMRKEAYEWRAIAQLLKKDYAAAIVDYTKVIQLEPTVGSNWVARGYAEFEAGDYYGALDDYTKALALEPGNATAKYWLDSTNKKLADPETAFQALVKRADMKFDRGDFDGAITDCTRALQTATNFSPPYIIRGSAFRAKKQYDAAIADFDRLIKLEPNLTMGYHFRGNVYFEKGEYDMALADYNAAIEIDANYAPIYTSRGQTYRLKGDLGLAIADLTKALQIDPQAKYANQNRGIAYASQSRFDLALADYNIALQKSPDNAELYNLRGFAYFRTDKLDNAAADLNKALQIDPKLSNAYRNRAECHLKQGNTDQSLADYNKAAELDPKDASIYSGRSSAYYQKGNYDLGIADLTKSASLDKKQPSIPIYRAWGHLFARRNDLAFEQVTTFLELNGLKGPDAPYAVIVGYLALRKSNKAAAAKAFLEQWIVQLPTDQWTADLLLHIRGGLPAGQLLTIADTNGKLTEAHTYIGQMQMLAGTANLAKIHLDWVKENGEKDYFEYFLANADLNLLAGGPLPKYTTVPVTKTPVTIARPKPVKPVSKVSKITQAETFYKSGLARGERSNNDDAVADFTAAIELNPRFAEAYFQRSRFRADEDNLADLTKAIELNPRYAEAYYERAMLQQALGTEANVQKTITLVLSDLNKAIEFKPNNTVAYGARGMVRSFYASAVRDLTGAIADYTKAIQLDPETAEWYEARSSLYQETGQTELADADGKKAEALRKKFDK